MGTLYNIEHGNRKCVILYLCGPHRVMGQISMSVWMQQSVMYCGADIDGPLHTACTAPAEERPASAARHAADG